MTVERDVADHYAQGGLIEAIEAALAKVGIAREAVTVDDLGPVDEFHIGGRPATVDLAKRLALTPDDRVLDVGCGIGGAARFLAESYGCHVTGIDLTAEYAEAARVLSDWVGLAERTDFEHASALALPFPDGGFDAAYMLHVGMNIAAKADLMAEIARVLAPGGRIGIYDVMRIGAGEITYPVPWAETAATSFVAAPDDYRAALAAAGLDVAFEENRRDWAIAFFKKLRERAASDGPPPFGLQIVMGADAGRKVGNMVAGLGEGIIAPVQMIARKP